MVNIIENRAHIEGIVNSISRTPDQRGFLQVDITVLKSVEVENLPNLAKSDEGKDIHVKVLPDQLPQLHIKKKSPISCVVRKAMGQVYFLVM